MTSTTTFRAVADHLPEPESACHKEYELASGLANRVAACMAAPPGSPTARPDRAFTARSPGDPTAWLSGVPARWLP
jgi:hypothetical protein